MTAIVRLQVDEQRVVTIETGDGLLVGGECTLNQGDEASQLSLEIVDDRLQFSNALPLPTKNSRVDIECWFGAPQRPPKIFAGFVVGYTPTFGPERLKILAVDKAKGTRRIKRSRNLTQNDPESLVRAIAEPQGLSVDMSEADISGLSFSSALQHAETDAELLNRVLPDDHRWFVRGDTLYVRKHDAFREEPEVIRLRYGVNVESGGGFEIDEFTPRDTPNLFDYDGEIAAEDGDVEAVDRPVHLRRSGMTIQTEEHPSYTSQALERAMEAEARAGEVFRGSITATEAYPKADVDDQVILEGFGGRFSGVWNIESITHQFVPERTAFELTSGGFE